MSHNFTPFHTLYYLFLYFFNTLNALKKRFLKFQQRLTTYKFFLFLIPLNNFFPQKLNLNLS